MKHSFKSLSKVSQAYIVYINNQSSGMGYDNLFMWIGYVCLGLVLVCFLLNKCWKYYKRHFKRDSENNLEVIIPSTCSTSSSFTYMPSVKSNHFNIPHGLNDGLSEFDDSILFDQPMSLSNKNPYCKQHAERGYTSSSEEPIERSSSSVIGRRGPLDDDLQTLRQLVDVCFNKSVLSITPYQYQCNTYREDTCSNINNNNSIESTHDIAKSYDSNTTQYSADISIDSVISSVDERRHSVLNCELDYKHELVTDV